MNIQTIEIPAIHFVPDSSFFEKFKQDHNLRFSADDEIMNALKNMDPSECDFGSQEALVIEDLDTSYQDVLAFLSQPYAPTTRVITLPEYLRNVFYFLNYKKDLLVNDGHYHTHIGLLVFNDYIYDATLLWHVDVNEWIATIYDGLPNLCMVRKIIALSDTEE